MTRVIPAVFLQQKANGWTMLSLDVSDAFLTVAQLEPTITKINGSWFKLHKMVPGQRAGSSRWFEAFTEHIKQGGARAELLLEQPALFRLPNRSGGGMVHVDDLMAAGVTKKFGRAGKVCLLKMQSKCRMDQGARGRSQFPEAQTHPCTS